MRMLFVVTRTMMEENVDEILIPPRDVETVFLVILDHLFLPGRSTQAVAVHEHHARVDTCMNVTTSQFRRFFNSEA